jgi:hypothetical protein
MIKHQLPKRYPMPDEFTSQGAEFTKIDRMGNVAIYRKRINKSVSYVVALGNEQGELSLDSREGRKDYARSSVLSVEPASFRALTKALERLDALYAASIGNPLYRSVSNM